MQKIPMFLVSLLLVFGFSVSALAAPYTGADIELLGSEFTSSYNFGVEDGTAAAVMDRGEGLVEYWVTLPTLGVWVWGLNVINSKLGNLGTDPTWYPYFEFAFDHCNPFPVGVERIAASDTEVNWQIFGSLPGRWVGTIHLRIFWMNDKYDEATGRDASVRINSVFFDNLETAPVPVPSTMLLLGSGFIGLAGFRRKWRKA